MSFDHGAGQPLAERPGDPKLLAINQSKYENSQHNTSYSESYSDSSGGFSEHKKVSIHFSIKSAMELTRGGPLELETKISRGAAHDSAERGPHAPKCDEGTREAVQDDVLSWIDRGIEALLWLTGPAGTGKSAIAGSIADKCHDESRKWLAGSFFFSDFAGQPDRYSKEYLFPTLAYHLIHLKIPRLREEILSAIDACPSVFDKRLDDQLRILILEPLRKVDETAIQSSTFKTIIIDGVDECKESGRATIDAMQDRRMSKDENHREIISGLIRASKDPSFPFRVIVASRPERAIERCFTSLPSGSFKHIFLDDKYSPTADIELYLRAKFDTIGRNHGLPDQWYLNLSNQDIPRYLAEEASGQFVYAATVVRFIQDDKDTPHEQLKRVLNWKGVKGSRPFAVLDALYSGILKSSPDPPLSIKWLRVIKYLQDVPLIVAGGKVPTKESWYQKAILESSPGQTEVVLGKLTALVGLRDDHGEPGFTFYHKSLTDFLEDKGRSGDLHLEREAVAQFLRERCYQVLKNRGPQGWLPPDLQEFYHTFSSELWPWLDLSRKYDASDVDWYIAQMLTPDGRLRFQVLDDMSGAFKDLHSHCPWYHCLPACQVWRKGILRHLKGIGYPVPTPLDLFKAKFLMWEHLGRIRKDKETFNSWKAAQAIEV
ncbi:hypothetical protein NMY22_g17026 [Coprinellus aureogranulatus]|nr:hypothetical protein NMY22_g17026 [Coprinellus aureogranulatus]